ncbi:MAG: repeat containing protein [Cyanobacteria bacterium RYN_339]|nr:repeat containing protein [Cyanobacteria bacterium RYN_339]
MAVCLALAHLAGCALLAPTKPKATTRPVAAKVDEAARPVPLAEPVRVIDVATAAAQITGKVKIISEHGGGIISNNTGGLLSNNGSGIVANNAGSLTGKSKRVLLAAAEEASLADAKVEVLDAAGNYLAGKDKQPLGGTSDASGAFAFNAALPDENLILRVRLFNGGQLFALLPRGKRAADLDTAASLGARFVLDTYVNRRQAVLDKLPAADAAKLHEVMEGARALLDGVPSYQPADLLAAATTLKAKAKPVDEQLEHIKAVILAGQANLGTGRPATQVALAAVSSLALDAAGNLYVGETGSGRVRRIAPDGTISVYAGGPHAKGQPINTPVSLLLRPDGSLWVADALGCYVRRIAPDGTVTNVVGNGRRDQKALGVPGASTSVERPTVLAAAADGAVLIGEAPTNVAIPGRLLRLDADGKLDEVAPPANWKTPSVTGLAVADDGTIYALNDGDHLLSKRAPDGTWTTLETDHPYTNASRIKLGPDGTLYLADSNVNAIVRFGPTGREVVIGKPNQPGFSPDGTAAATAQVNAPCDMLFRPDGALLFSDAGNGLVRMIDLKAAAHTVTTLAGTRSPTQTGDATGISISSPGSIALDSQGRVVVAETTGHTLKRLDGQSLVVIAGSARGKAEDTPVSALQAHFDTPAGIAYDGAVLYVVDSVNERLRRIDEAGQVTSVAGPIDGKPVPDAQFVPARQMKMPRALGLAVGPDHMPYFTDNDGHRVMRIRPDGRAEVVVGLESPKDGGFTGDGGPALRAQLRLPTCLTFDRQGDLYIADTGNLCVRKVTGLAGATPTISTIAGLPLFNALAVLGAAVPDDEGKPATGALIMGPGGLTVDAAGNLFVTELGTTNLSFLSAAGNLGELSLPSIGARIRKITPDGLIHTVAGDGTSVLNNPDQDDYLITPAAIVVDAKGRLIISDGGSNQLKLLELKP